MTQFVDPLPPRRERLFRSLGPALVLIAVFFVWVQFARPFAWTPLVYVNPQEVLAPSVVAGLAMPVRGTKCNSTDEAVAVTGTFFLVRLDPRSPIIMSHGQAVRQPGCTTSTWANYIPADTPPGTYRFEGIEVAEDGERVQRGAWYSEPFEVVAP